MGCAHRCTFCYVRAFERRADRPADDRYGTSIRVKINVAEVLRLELARPSWEREQVTIGAATDPYQPAEGRYRLTRACLEALAEARNPFGIITRGPMIVRDIDVLAEAARRASVSVTFSIPTLDEDVWRKTEPSTAHPRQRLRAVSMLVKAGIRAGVGMAPILPGLSDKPSQLAEVVKAARDAGACGIWANLLYLRPGTREHFLDSLARDWPESSTATRVCTRTGAPTFAPSTRSRSARRWRSSRENTACGIVVCARSSRSRRSIAEQLALEPGTRNPEQLDRRSDGLSRSPE